MSLPNQIVLIRHGQSEANIVQKAEERDPTFVAPEGYYDLHDSDYRLSPLGVEQAKLAGQWIMENLGDPAKIFDRCYVSPFVRALETAYYVGGPACKWLIDDRFRERDWGTYGATPMEERKKRYADTEKRRSQSYWYTSFDGGEGPANNVHGRVRDIMGTWHRDVPEGRVAVVAHGDFVNVVRYPMEDMLPKEWDIMDADKSQEPTNGSILIYNRTNPEDPADIRKRPMWRKMIRPDDIENSPFGGQWVELPGRRYFSGADLGAMVDRHPRLFPQDDAATEAVGDEAKA